MIIKLNNEAVFKSNPKEIPEGISEVLHRMKSGEVFITDKKEAAALNALLSFIGGGYLSIC